MSGNGKIIWVKPEYMLPTMRPICPVHNCRMYIHRHYRISTEFRCQHPDCDITATGTREIHVAVSEIEVGNHASPAS